MLTFLKKIFSSENTPVLLDSKLLEGALLVDVRNPQELNTGQVTGAVNIPLSQVAENIDKFKNQKQIILFCRTGNRAGIAKSILQSNGITNVSNGGSWKDVHKAVKGK